MFAFGTRRGADEDRSSSSLRRALFRLAAVANGSPSSLISWLTQTPFPPRATCSVWGNFRSPFGTMGFSDFCWAIGFHPFVLRPTSKLEPSRSLGVRITDIERIPSPLLQAETNRNWASLLGASSPSTQALRRFTLVRDAFTPMASSRPALAGGPPTEHSVPLRNPDRCSGPSPCLLGGGFPLLGPQDRILL